MVHGVLIWFWEVLTYLLVHGGSIIGILLESADAGVSDLKDRRQNSEPPGVFYPKVLVHQMFSCGCFGSQTVC